MASHSSRRAIFVVLIGDYIAALALVSLRGKADQSSSQFLRSLAIVQDTIGHERVAISQNYTHIDEAAKRTAISAILAFLD
jgi:hypothetical protein